VRERERERERESESERESSVRSREGKQLRLDISGSVERYQPAISNSG